MTWLVDIETGEPLVIGQRVQTFKGEVGRLLSATRPKHSGSTGRVDVQLDGSEFRWSWYPSVIGAEWRERPEVGA